MGGCQHYGPSLGTLNVRCRIIIRIQNGTIILTTAHISKRVRVQDVASGVENQMEEKKYGN